MFFKLKQIFAVWTQREKSFFFAALVIGVMSALALAGVFIQRSTLVVPAEGGEYTEGIVGQPAIVNPVLASTDTDKTLVRLLFANTEQISEKIDIEDGGRLWRLRLREGLRWSNGEKLTADDIVFTVAQIQNPEMQSPLFASWQGITVGRESELEVRFQLIAPYPFFIDSLRMLYAVPKHLFADIPPTNWKLSGYNLQPVGSGPYAFAHMDKQPNGFISSYHLKTNPEFGGEKPLIPSVRLKFFLKSESLVQAFNGGQVNGFATLDPQLLSTVKRPYNLHAFDLPSYYAVFLNQSQNVALQDPVVRRALAAATDRERLIQEVFAGRATPIVGPVLPAVTGDNPSSQTPDVAAITADLEEASWIPGENGRREKKSRAGVTPLQLTLITPRIPFLLETAELLAEDWRKIGAEVQIAELPPADVLSQTVKTRDYQALLFGNVLNPAADLYSFWHSNERFFPGLNLALYQDSAADRLIEASRKNFDPVKRLEELKDLQEIIQASQPAIFLYSPRYLFVASKDLRGVETRLLAEGTERFSDIGAWHLKTARTLR